MRPGPPPPWLPCGSLNLWPRAPVSVSVPVGPGGGRQGHALLSVPGSCLGPCLGPGARGPRLASGPRGLLAAVHPLSLGVSSWESGWGRGGNARWFCGDGGGRDPGCGSASCVWVVLSTVPSPWDCVTHRPGSPGCRASVCSPSCFRFVGAQRPPPWACLGVRSGRGPALPSDWVPLVSESASPSAHPAGRAPWGLRGHPEFSLCLTVPLQGPACPEVAVASCLLSSVWSRRLGSRSREAGHRGGIGLS